MANEKRTREEETTTTTMMRCEEHFLKISSNWEARKTTKRENKKILTLLDSPFAYANKFCGGSALGINFFPVFHHRIFFSLHRLKNFMFISSW